MRRLCSIAVLLCLGALTGCDRETQKSASSDSSQASDAAVIQFTNRVAEVSCGQCQLEMKGDGCDLAVRIDGKSYYVDGSSIDDHGDAHGDGGLCNCIRKAKVSGEIVDGRFVAKSVEVVKSEPKK